MNDEAVFRRALQHAVDLSAEVQLAVEGNPNGKVLMALLVRARDRAARAIVHLANADPEDTTFIRKMQNEITCFRLICEWLREIVIVGVDAADTIDEAVRVDLADVLGVTDLNNEE